MPCHEGFAGALTGANMRRMHGFLDVQAVKTWFATIMSRYHCVKAVRMHALSDHILELSDKPG